MKTIAPLFLLILLNSCSTQNLTIDNHATLKKFAFPKKGVSVYKVKIAIHKNAGYSIIRAKKAILRTNKLLKKIIPTKNTHAFTKLTYNPKIKILKKHTGLINSESDFNKLCSSSTANIIIVYKINWCENKGSFFGCTNVEQKCTLLTKQDRALEPVLWAHEMGHMLGLPHRKKQFALMHPHIKSGNTQLDFYERSVFLQKTK